jgi:hypothetical protein
VQEDDEKTRRQYIRLKTPGCFGELQIKAIGSHAISSNSRRVLIDDISPGGLCFLSGLRFPSNRKIRVVVLTTISGIRFEAEGLIVWRRADENMYVYGVMFEITALHRSFLIRMLNQLYMQQFPEHKRIHQYYTYMCNLYLQDQRTRINYTI